MRKIKAKDYNNIYSQIVKYNNQHLICSYGDCSCGSCKRQKKKKGIISILVIYSTGAKDNYLRDDNNLPIYFESIKQAKQYISTLKG